MTETFERLERPTPDDPTPKDLGDIGDNVDNVQIDTEELKREIRAKCEAVCKVHQDEIEEYYRKEREWMKRHNFGIIKWNWITRDDVIGVIRNPNRYVTKAKREHQKLCDDVKNALEKNDASIPIVSLPPMSYDAPRTTYVELK